MTRHCFPYYFVTSLKYFNLRQVKITNGEDEQSIAQWRESFLDGWQNI